MRALRHLHLQHHLHGRHLHGTNFTQCPSTFGKTSRTNPYTPPTTTPMMTTGPTEHLFGQPSELQVHWAHQTTAPSQSFPPSAPTQSFPTNTGPQPLSGQHGPISKHSSPPPTFSTFSTPTAPAPTPSPMPQPTHLPSHQWRFPKH